MTFSFARKFVLSTFALLAWSNLAVAEDRSLDLYNMNTKETLSVVYKRDGAFDVAALKKLDWFLRDWRLGVSRRMDSRLYDLVWQISKATGSASPVYIHSGFRSKETNSLLRRTRSGVAKHSQHINGTAMDFHIPGVATTKLREIAMRLQGGGVGFYPKANFPFVHVDVADVRHWPPMSRQQLARLFPDGRTAYMPSDRKPLDSFKEVLAAITAKKNKTVLSKPERTVVAALPKRPPLPMNRPAFEIEGSISIASSHPLPELTNAFAPVFIPRQPVFDRILDPKTALAVPGYASLKRDTAIPKDTRKFEALPINVIDDKVLVDRGVGEKGPRLLPEGRAPSKYGWKIFGWL